MALVLWVAWQQNPNLYRVILHFDFDNPNQNQFQSKSTANLFECSYRSQSNLQTRFAKKLFVVETSIRAATETQLDLFARRRCEDQARTPAGLALDFPGAKFV